jgi:L-fuconolactonase
LKGGVVAFVIDSHHHFWDPAQADYPWMTEELAAIRRRFGPDDLRPLLEGSRVDRTVVVQTRSSLEETRQLLEVAEATDFVAGVVGWVDLADVDVARVIDDLREGPGGRFLVGVRHQVHDEPDPAWLCRTDVRRGLASLRDAGLVYDLLVRTPQLPAALETARALPDLRLVMDHLAKPRIAAGREDHEWEAAMAPFADLTNVTCKLSGMVTEADWETWTPADLEPYVRRCLDWFGEDRLMFGSDWPVCLLAATYGTVVDTLRQLLADLPEPAAPKVFGANATRVYRSMP